MTETETIIRVDRLTAGFNGTPVLKEVSFSVGRAAAKAPCFGI